MCVCKGCSIFTIHHMEFICYVESFLLVQGDCCLSGLFVLASFKVFIIYYLQSVSSVLNLNCQPCLVVKKVQ